MNDTEWTHEKRWRRDERTKRNLAWSRWRRLSEEENERRKSIKRWNFFFYKRQVLKTLFQSSINWLL